MSRLSRRGVFSAGKTYADWLAHIAARTSTVRTWNDAPATGQTVQRTTANAAAAGDLYGSVWGAGQRAAAGSTISRMVQHAMASQADFNAQVANSGAIIFTLTFSGYAGYFSLNRNGYTSATEASGTGFIADEVSYWDFTLGKPMTMVPKNEAGPTPYADAGWV